jgi:uncharacterized protein (DUF4415 family)
MKKDGWMKKSNPKDMAIALEEVEKEFDFSRAEKRVVTINLDNEIVEYFKELSLKTGKGYQVLIKDALKFFIEEKLEPKMTWKK